MSKKEQNNDILYIVIIGLLVIIGILAFFIGKSLGNNSASIVTSTGTIWALHEDFTITVIDDLRCSTCKTDEFITQIQQAPGLSNIAIKRVDFGDKGIREQLEDEKITTLPAIIFSHNSGLDAGLIQYLRPLPSGQYSLSIGATFNPFIERSERGFLILENEKLEEIKEAAYIQWNPDANITWIEYSDLECPFCARLHTDGTPGKIKELYGDDINLLFQHFPLGFHANAKTWAEIAECLGEQQWVDAFYALIEKSFQAGNSNKSFLIDEAVALGANEAQIKICLDNKSYSEKVDTQMSRGTQLFWVTGTPGNVLINTKTGEYEVLSGAYPAASFEEIINRLK